MKTTALLLALPLVCVSVILSGCSKRESSHVPQGLPCGTNEIQGVWRGVTYGKNGKIDEGVDGLHFASNGVAEFMAIPRNPIQLFPLLKGQYTVISNTVAVTIFTSAPGVDQKVTVIGMPSLTNKIAFSFQLVLANERHLTGFDREGQKVDLHKMNGSWELNR